jgi:AraC family transcriptional regulator, regulatory protein of adaptative response / DNA-3-methyladenine glycosylase II
MRGIPGIGESTAHYIAMRALGEPDAFPFGDPGLRSGLGRDGHPASLGEVERMAEGWRPWRAYAAMQICTGTGRRAGRGKDAPRVSAEKLRDRSTG